MIFGLPAATILGMLRDAQATAWSTHREIVSLRLSSIYQAAELELCALLALVEPHSPYTDKGPFSLTITPGSVEFSDQTSQAVLVMSNGDAMHDWQIALPMFSGLSDIESYVYWPADSPMYECDRVGYWLPPCCGKRCYHASFNQWSFRCVGCGTVTRRPPLLYGAEAEILALIDFAPANTANPHSGISGDAIKAATQAMNKFGSALQTAGQVAAQAATQAFGPLLQSGVYYPHVSTLDDSTWPDVFDTPVKQKKRKKRPAYARKVYERPRRRIGDV